MTTYITLNLSDLILSAKRVYTTNNTRNEIFLLLPIVIKPILCIHQWTPVSFPNKGARTPLCGFKEKGIPWNPFYFLLNFWCILLVFNKCLFMITIYFWFKTNSLSSNQYRTRTSLDLYSYCLPSKIRTILNLTDFFINLKKLNMILFKCTTFNLLPHFVPHALTLTQFLLVKFEI